MFLQSLTCKRPATREPEEEQAIDRTIKLTPSPEPRDRPSPEIAPESRVPSPESRYNHSQMFRRAASPPLRRATSTSAAREPRFSTGSTRAAMAGRSCFGSRTPMPSGPRGRWSRASSRACAGWGSIGMRGRMLADRMRRTSSRSGSIGIARWRRSWSRKARPITATARRRRFRRSGRPPRPRAAGGCTTARAGR